MYTQATPVKYIDFTESYNPGMKYWGGASILLTLVAVFGTVPRIEPGVGARFVYVMCALIALFGYLVYAYIDIRMSYRHVELQNDGAGYRLLRDRYSKYGTFWLLILAYIFISSYLFVPSLVSVHGDTKDLLGPTAALVYGIIGFSWGLVAQWSNDNFENR